MRVAVLHTPHPRRRGLLLHESGIHVRGVRARERHGVVVVHCRGVRMMAVMMTMPVVMMTVAMVVVAVPVPMMLAHVVVRE